MRDILTKFNFILDDVQKRGLLFFLVLTFIGMILETIGITAIIPLLSSLLDTNTNYFFEIDIFKEISADKKIIFSLYFIVFIFFLKFIFQIFLIFFQSRFVFRLKQSISKKLLKFYLRKDYIYFLNKNSSEIIRNINTEVMYFGFALISLTNVIIDILIFLGIVILLIFLLPKETFFLIIIFTIIIFTYLKTIKYKNQIWGEERQFTDAKLIKIIQQTFLNIKYIKSLNNHNKIISEFEKHNSKSADLDINYNLILNLPRVCLELVAILSVILMAGVFFDINSSNSSNLIIMLSLYATAAFKLLPTLNRVLNNLQTFRYYKPSIILLNNELSKVQKFKDKQELTESEISNYSFNKSLELKDINFSFKDNKKFKLNNFNLKVSKGEILGLVGESGSGKTTILDMITGLISPDSGEVLADDKTIYDARILKRMSEYVPQKVFLTDDTLKNNIEFFSIDIVKNSDEKLDKILDITVLKDFVTNLKFGVNSGIGEDGAKISGGQRQRIGIARSLYHNPKILILDEATSGLNENIENKLINNVKKHFHEITIIIVSHRKSTLQLCDRVFNLNKMEYQSDK